MSTLILERIRLHVKINVMLFVPNIYLSRLYKINFGQGVKMLYISVKSKSAV